MILSLLSFKYGSTSLLVIFKKNHNLHRRNYYSTKSNSQMEKKEYKKGNLTVVWKKDVCIHAGNCVKGLPGVFKVNAKPWINVDGADTEAIKKQIDRCPSGALSYIISEAEVTNLADKSEFIEVEVMKDGPLLVHAKVTIDNDGETIVKEVKQTAFCRCGASDKKPFCDGSHRKIGFEG
jgi:uncharacterized Fe-S cluster protein YjdI